MSDFSAKNQRGLMEAYASMYQQPIQEDKVEDVEYQEYEINPDALYESIVNYLVSEGYVETEKKAEAMIPHLSEGWFNDIVGTIVINEHFIECVNSFIEEGCDLSSYTWDELYEEYTGHLSNVITEEYRNLNEVTGALAPVLSTPLGAGAALGAAALGTLGKIKKDLDYLRTSKQWGYGDPAAKRWLETGSFEARKEKDPARVKASREAAQRAQQQRQQQQTAQKPVGTTTTVASPAQSGASTGAAGSPPGGGPGGGPGNKPPKIDPLQTVKDIWRGTKEFVGKGKGPLSQVLGKPARERFFGSTRPGQLTRGIATTAGSAADIIGTAADPTGTTKSRLAQLGSIGPGFVGTLTQGVGKVLGGDKPTGGGGLERGIYQAGKQLRQVGRQMRDQPWTSPFKNW